MHRFFADFLDENSAVLNEEEAAHALKVLRLRQGDACQALMDGSVYEATISQIQPQVILQLGEKLPSPEPSIRVTLYQGLPKADKMEMIAQKTTELGVYAIRPVTMERCVVKLEGKDAGKKTERWQKIAREAVKQCARVTVPEVLLPKKLTQLEEELKQLDVLIVRWEDARDGSIRQALAPFEGREALRVGILIGPEGGISGQEAHWLAENAGAKLVTLGPRILRTETAGLCALTMVMAYRGEME